MEDLNNIEDLVVRKRLSREQKMQISKLFKKYKVFARSFRRMPNPTYEFLKKTIQDLDMHLEKRKLENNQVEAIIDLVERLKGGGGVEFRVYETVGDHALDRVRSTGWKDH